MQLRTVDQQYQPDIRKMVGEKSAVKITGPANPRNHTRHQAAEKERIPKHSRVKLQPEAHRPLGQPDKRFEPDSSQYQHIFDEGEREAFGDKRGADIGT